MRLKNGVKLLGIKPELLCGLLIANRIWKEHGKTLVVTSVVDGKHSPKSAHYKGFAADLRTRYFSIEKKKIVAMQLQDELGDDFDVVLEDTHMHLEYDPLD